LFSFFWALNEAKISQDQAITITPLHSQFKHKPNKHPKIYLFNNCSQKLHLQGMGPCLDTKARVEVKDCQEL
jgi:hypothetical protein